MSTRADTGTADITGTRDDRATPARLRRLPSRLLTQTAMHADRLVNEGLARADDRKWHYAVLAALQEFGPASQAALSRRTGIYRSDLVAIIQDDLLAPLTQPERDQLVRLLARLLDHHARAAPQPTGDPGPRHSAGLSESSR